MNREQVRAAIADVLATIAPEVDLASLDASTALREQIDLDSMDFLNVIVGLHERLQVDIPEADYGKLASLDSMLDYLVAKTGG